MQAAPTVKFQKGNKSDFYATLKQRVDQYFRGHHTSKYANALMILKSISFFLVGALAYGLIISDQFTAWQMLGLVIVFGMSSVFFVFNVAHDASHNAYSKNPTINKLLTYTWNIIGISSYMWNLKHNISHHTYTNVTGTDWDIEQGFFLRFHPNAPRRAHHKYQHLYAPFLYGLMSIYAVFIKDFQMCNVKQLGNKKIDRHPTREYVILYASKAVYVAYNLVIPVLVLSIAWWQILIGFFVMHMCIGVVMAFVLAPVHVTHGAHFVAPDERGRIDNSWAVHQIQSTIDFSANSFWVNWFCGGLNTHVCHHIFPNICHIHYRPLTKIIHQTAEEHGIKYENRPLWTAMRDHLLFLRDLGRYDKPGLQAAA